MSHNELMVSSSAVDLFEGKERARCYVIDAIRETRVNADLRPHELGNLAGLSDPNVVYKIENGTAPLTLDVVQSLMTALELPIDSVLPLPPLTPEQSRIWEEEMDHLNAGELAPSGGTGRLNPNVAVGLFVRLKALQEICE